MSKFWRGGSASSCSSDNSDDSMSMNDTNNGYSYSTPPRQPIMPINDPDTCWRMIRQDQVYSAVPTVTSNLHAYDPSSYTRLICMSDTHGRHRSVLLPKGDILLHGGDFTNTGEIKSIQDLSQYFGSWKEQNAQSQVVCIAGNHDLTFHAEQYAKSRKHFHRTKGPYDTNFARNSLTNCIYLQDESYQHPIPNNKNGYATNPNHIHIYGSPWQPTFGYFWVFNMDRGDIHKKWDQIPAETDVLLTHGPPLGRGDRLTEMGRRAGCYELMRQIQNRIKPRVHVSGHIHEDHGTCYDGTTLYVNASSMDYYFDIGNSCVVVDLPHDKSLPALVVEPYCTLSREELVQWFREKKYTDLANIMEQTEEVEDGQSFMLKDVRELVSELVLHRRNDVIRLKRMLREAQLHLRAESY